MIKKFDAIAHVIHLDETIYFNWKTGPIVERHKLLKLYINEIGCEVGFLALEISTNTIISIGFDLYEEFISEGNHLGGF